MNKNTVPTFVLEIVEMTSFRLFSSLKAEFHPRLTVLVAPNSGGKTALLDGLCYLLKAFITHQEPHLIEKDKYKREGTLISVGCSLWGRIRFLGSLKASINGENDVSSFEIGACHGLQLNPANSIQATTSSENLKTLQDHEIVWSKSADNGSQLYASKSALLVADAFKARIAQRSYAPLPLIAYFTANRRIEYLSKPDFDHSFELSSKYAFSSLLPCEGLTDFDQWLRERAINSLETRLELEEDGDFTETEPDNHLKAVSAVLAKMLSQEVNIKNVKYFSRNKGIQAVKVNGERISINELSHGAKSVLTIAAELAMNCCALNPHFKEEAPAKTPGIILIDEIDLHLHPKWQQHVLDDLQECFPCMQFIVSTHSPAVLTTVRKENIREIHVDPETGMTTVTEPLSRSYGESSGDLQETIMGVSARPNNPSVQALKKYLNWAENGALDEDRSSDRAELEAEWGSDHVDLFTADMIIKRRKILSEKK